MNGDISDLDLAIDNMMDELDWEASMEGAESYDRYTDGEK